MKKILKPSMLLIFCLNLLTINECKGQLNFVRYIDEFIEICKKQSKNSYTSAKFMLKYDDITSVQSYRDMVKVRYIDEAYKVLDGMKSIVIDTNLKTFLSEIYEKYPYFEKVDRGLALNRLQINKIVTSTYDMETTKLYLKVIDKLNEGKHRSLNKRRDFRRDFLELLDRQEAFVPSNIKNRYARLGNPKGQHELQQLSGRSFYRLLKNLELQSADIVSLYIDNPSKSEIKSNMYVGLLVTLSYSDSEGYSNFHVENQSRSLIDIYVSPSFICIINEPIMLQHTRKQAEFIMKKYHLERKSELTISLFIVFGLHLYSLKDDYSYILDYNSHDFYKRGDILKYILDKVNSVSGNDARRELVAYMNELLIGFK